MKASEIIHFAEVSGLELWAEQETLHYSEPTEPDEVLLTLLREHKPALIKLLENRRIPRLPDKLEALVRAASGNHLSCTIRGVHDVNRYVLAWAAGYLTGDWQQAVEHLWEVHRAWRQFP